VTPDRLRRLADLNEEAAQFTTSPSWARSYRDAARMARYQAARLDREQATARLRGGLGQIKAELAGS
jgi:hypothetical protein